MIGAHIVYNMWKNVGSSPTFIMVGEDEEKKEKTYQVEFVVVRVEVGCSAWTGAGRPSVSSSVSWRWWVVVVTRHQVTLTITLLLYFTLVSKERFHLPAVLIINVTDTVINLLMCLAILLGFFQVRNLR